MATKKKTTTDLTAQLQEAKRAYSETMLKIRSGQEKNTNAARNFKKTIAQIKTKLHLQQLTNK